MKSWVVVVVVVVIVVVIVVVLVVVVVVGFQHPVCRLLLRLLLRSLSRSIEMRKLSGFGTRFSKRYIRNLGAEGRVGVLYGPIRTARANSV